MSFIVNKIFPSLYSGKIERSPPANVPEGLRQANSLINKFHVAAAKENHNTLFRLFSSVVELNNRMATIIKNHPVEVSVATSLALKCCMKSDSLKQKAGIILANVAIQVFLTHAFKQRSVVFGKYKQELEKLANELVDQAFPDGLRVAKLLKEIENPIFLSITQNALSQKIISTPLSNRFIYEIRWKNNLVGVLIGTVHSHSKLVAQDPIIAQTIKKCQKAFLEVGVVTIIRAFESLLGPLNHCLDAQCAMNSSSIALPLDSPSDVLTCILKVAQLRRRTISLRFIAPSLVEYFNAFSNSSPENQTLILQTTYLTADSGLMQKLMECALPPDDYKSLLLDRNQKWLGKLVQPLKEATKPIAIVVGVAHCFGEGGLVSELEKQQFSVTRKG